MAGWMGYEPNANTGTRKPAAKPKPKGKSSKPKSSTSKSKSRFIPGTKIPSTGDPTLDAALAKIGGGGATVDATGLESELVGAVRNQYVFLTPSSKFVNGRGQFHTKVKGSELLAALTDKSKLSDAEFKQLQEKLFRGGFYGTNNRKAISWGNRYDAGTREAYASAMAANIVANQTTKAGSRVSISDIIDTSAQFGPAATQDGASGETFAFQRPDPAVLRSTLDVAMPALIGRKLSAAETQQFIDEFNAKTEASARSAFDAKQAGGVAALPDVDPQSGFAAFVKEKARERYPVETGVVEREQAADTFFNAITGGGPQTAEF